jgi:putative aldouronate transport system substrate-binding protein
MRNKSLRMVAFGAAIGLSGALSACSTGPGTTSASPANLASVSVGAMKNFTVGEAFKATTPMSFSMLYSDQPTYPLKSDWLLFNAITKATNVSLKPTIVPMSDYAAKRSLLIGAGSAPLIIPKTYPGQETPFIQSGAILPVSDYVKLMPNFEQKVKEWGLQGELNDLKQAGGKYYVLPGVHQQLWPDYTLVVRTDIFKKAGIAIPTTWDGLKTALTQLKADYPGSIPFSDRFMGGATLNIASTAYGTSMGAGTFHMGDGTMFSKATNKFVYAAAQPQYEQLLAYLNSLVKGGLMDPESFTQTDDQAQAKFTSGKSFVISANAQNVVDYQKAMDQSLGKGKYSISKITVPSGPAGNVITGSRLENGVMISSAALKSPNFVAMMQFIDWLYYSDAGQEFAKWGVQGTTYTKSAAGVRTLEPGVNFLGLNPAGAKDLRKDFGFSGGVFAYGGSTNLLQSVMSPAELVFQKAMATKTAQALPPPAPLSETDMAQATLVETPLQDYVDQNTLQFILGQRPLSQFGAFVTELQGKGMNTYLAMKNKAYTDFKKKN